MTDAELIRQFLHDRSQAAFAELVGRHVDWVYSTALRRVRDPHLAEDVTQATFIVLAQKAHSLTNQKVLSAWLFHVVAHVSAQALRKEARRRHYERLAAEVKQMTESTESSRQEQGELEQIAGVLDDVVGSLGGGDRQAVLLRFYERKTFAEVGATLGITEEAARKRVSRAVEKLRGILSAKGVTMPATALAGLLLEELVKPAPPALAGAISGAALSTASSGATSLAKAASAVMTWSKLKLAAAIILAAIVSIGGGAAAVMQLASAERSPATQPVQGDAAAREMLAQYQKSVESLTRIHYTFTQEDVLEGDYNWQGNPHYKWVYKGEFFRDGQRLRANSAHDVFAKSSDTPRQSGQQMTIVGPDGLEPDLVLYLQDDGQKRSGLTLPLDIMEPEERSWAYSLAAPEFLWGRVDGSHMQPLWVLMSQGSSLSVLPALQDMNGHATHLVEATTSYGRFRLWLDPQAGFLPRRIEAHKSENDLYGDKPLGKVFPITVPRDGTLRVPNVSEKTWDFVVGPIEIVRAGQSLVISKINSVQTTHYVDGKVTISRQQYAREGIDLNPDFAALGAFKVGVPDGTLVMPRGEQQPEDPKLEWRGGRIVQIERLYGRAVFDDGSPVTPLGWVAWLTKEPEQYVGSTGFVREIFKPDGLFSVSLTSSQRELCAKNFGGQLQIRGRIDGKMNSIGEVNLSELGADPEHPPVLTFARKATTRP